MTDPRPVIVAIDGPAGSGKSSLCAAVCKKLGWTYINTGALYRAVAVVARQQKIAFSDEDSLASIADLLAKNAAWDPDSETLMFEGRDLSADLATAQAGNDASAVARIGKVRDALMPLQRRLALMSRRGSLVEGRDIGTVIFPDAHIKVFMTANLQERARRRLLQLMAQDQNRKGAQAGVPPTGENLPQDMLDEVLKDISVRDEQDAKRGNAPLKRATDAVIFDTSDLPKDKAVDALISLFESHGLLKDNR